MDLSVAGLIGAGVGLVVGIVNYGLFTRLIEPKLRALDRSDTAAEREDFERRIKLARRLVFVFDVVATPVVGYAIAKAIFD